MTDTDGGGYQSAWRADHARDVPAGDPWAAPTSWPTVSNAEPSVSDHAASAPLGDSALLGDSVLPGDPAPLDESAAGPLDPSTSEHVTAPWPFVTSRAAFPDATDAPFPPWPGHLVEPMPPAVWPPTDLPQESAPGVWSPPPSESGTASASAQSASGKAASDAAGPVAPASVSPASSGSSMPPAWSRQAPPPWPRQSAPPRWPLLPDTAAGDGRAPIPEQTAPASGPRPSTTEPVSPAPVPSRWASAAGMAAPGVYLPGPHEGLDASGGYGPPGGPGTSGGNPRSRRRGVIAVAVVVAVLVISGVAIVIGTRSGSHGKAGTSSAAGPSAGASAGAPPATVPSGSTSSGSPADSVPLGDGRALIGKIVPAPPGAHVYDVDDSSAGVMNVRQYVRHYFNGDASELNRLRQEGFQIAASTDYVRSDGIEIATHLVQFADATGARDYFAVEKSAWAADHRVTSTFEVPATPDAVGYELSKADSPANRRSVTYEAVGNVVVVVNVYTPHKIDQAIDAKAMQAQLAALG